MNASVEIMKALVMREKIINALTDCGLFVTDLVHNSDGHISVGCIPCETGKIMRWPDTIWHSAALLKPLTDEQVAQEKIFQYELSHAFEDEAPGPNAITARYEGVDYVCPYERGEVVRHHTTLWGMEAFSYGLVLDACLEVYLDGRIPMWKLNLDSVDNFLVPEVLVSKR